MRRLAEWLMVIGFAALMSLLIIEWLVGCGETYVDAKGERHAYECVLIPQEKTK